MNRTLLIRMIRQSTQHLSSVGDGVRLGLPATGSTAEYASNTECLQFSECPVTILKQIEGTMKSDLESVVARVKTQRTCCDEIDPTLNRARPDDNPLQTSASCLLDLRNGSIQNSFFGEEIRELERT